MTPDVITWNPSPEIFSIGGFAVRWYGLLFAAGFLIAYAIISKNLRKANITDRDIDMLLLYIVIGTILGARLGHTLFYEADYYLAHPIDIFKPWTGTIGSDDFQFGIQGLASHGGAVGVLIAILLWARSKNVPGLWILDRITIVTALTAAFIRLGNLMNSEIIGEPADVAWGFIFTRIDSVPRHPAQLYEALAYLATFVILFFIFRKREKQTPNGFYFGWFFILIFGSRFFVEYFKEAQTEASADLALKMGQILSLPFILAGILLVIYANRYGKVSPVPLKQKQEDQLNRNQKRRRQKK